MLTKKVAEKENSARKRNYTAFLRVERAAVQVSMNFPLLCSTLGSDGEAQSHLLHASPGTGLGRASVTAVGDASLAQRSWHLKKFDKVKRPTGAWWAVTFLSEASSLPSPKSTCVIISASAPRGTN